MYTIDLFHQLLKFTIFLFMGCYIHKTPFTKGARTTVELFLNFYFTGHQQDVDWIREALGSHFTMSGIEIVHFNGAETTDLIAVNLDDACIGSTVFVLFISTQGSYPNFRNITVAEGDLKSGPDTLLYKFQNPLAKSSFNFTITCLRTCVFEFSMVLASSAAGIDVSFKDKFNSTLGIQLPADSQVHFQINPIAFSEDYYMTTAYESFNKWPDLRRNIRSFILPSGVYMIFSRFNKIERMLKYSVPISKIRVLPINNYDHLYINLNERYKLDVVIRTMTRSDNNSYIFYPRMRGILKDEVEKIWFKFDRLGRSNATVKLYSDTEVEDTLDLTIYAVTANQSQGHLITYFPMTLSIHEPPDYNGDFVDNDSYPSPENLPDDATTLDFPTIDFDDSSISLFSYIDLMRCIFLSFISLFSLSRLIFF